MATQGSFDRLEEDFGGMSGGSQPTKITNREKMEILERYSVVFENDNVFTYSILPILLSKPYLLAKIELFYDRQFEEILRRKSLAAIDFPHIVHESMKSKFRESKNYFVQSLANVIYSAEKYANENEISLFLEFCLKKGENQKLMFYLFLRQHFKILTYTTFLSHYKTSSDPSKISISFDNANEIILVAFSHEKIAQEKLLEAVKSKFAKGSKIHYYDFMMACMNVRMIYADLPMLDKAIALYRVTNFSELTSAFAQKNLIEINQNQTGTVNAGLKASLGDGRVLSAMNETSGNNGSRDLNSSSRGDRGQLKGRAEQGLFINPKYKSFYEAVKAEIKPFSEKSVNQFMEKEKIDSASQGEQTAVVNQHVQKKLFYIVNSIFGEDRRRFLAILRTDVESEPGILDFWMDLQDLLKETNRMGIVNPNVASDFLGKITSYATVATQLKFLMNFRLGNIEQKFDTSLDV